MFLDLIEEMIDGGTLSPLTEEEQGKLNKHLNNEVVFWIIETENEREYLK